MRKILQSLGLVNDDDKSSQDSDSCDKKVKKNKPIITFGYKLDERSCVGKDFQRGNFSSKRNRETSLSRQILLILLHIVFKTRSLIYTYVNPSIRHQDGEETSLSSLDTSHIVFKTRSLTYTYVHSHIHTYTPAYDIKTERKGFSEKDFDTLVEDWSKRMVRLKMEIIAMKEVYETPNLVKSSMYDAVPEKEVRDFLCRIIHDKTQSSLSGAIGSLVGLVVSDAVGHWFEFMDVVDLPRDHGAGSFDSTSFKFTAPIRNKFLLKPGQWTDDSYMALCMADSLISKLEFDGSDIRIRFWSWWFRGYCNTFRRDEKRKNKASVGLGGNISKSLLGMDPHVTPPSRVPNSGRNDSGNGSLMRLAPISIFFADDLNVLLDRAGLSSLTTHPGMEAVEACKFLAFLTSRAIHTDSSSTSMKAFLDDSVRVYLRDVLPPSEKKGDGKTEMRRLLIAKESSDSLERNWNWRESRLYIRDTLHARIKASPDGTYNGDHPVSLSYFGAYCMDGLAVALHSLYNTR